MKIEAIYRLLIGLSFTASLFGCSSVAPDFSDMSQTYQRVIEKYQNNNLLLNIVRSSKNMPLSFLDIPNVIGTGTISETAGLAGLFYSGSPGGGLAGVFSASAGSYTNPSVSLSLGRSFNFTQSSLENAQFEKEFLSIIPIETINFFARHHIPPELIFNLSIDAIETRTPDGRSTVFFNNPTAPNFHQFQELLRHLIDYGLTTEIIKVESLVGPPLDVNKMGPVLGQVILQYLEVKSKEQLNFKPVGKNKPDHYQITQLSEVARLCFSNSNMVDAIKLEYGESMLCRNPLGTKEQKRENVGITGTISPNKSKTSIAIQIRSNKDVYHYLGEVLAAQSQGDPRMTYLRPTTISGISKNQENEMRIPILVVHKNPPIGEKSIVSIEYDGDLYTIPSKDSGYSALVIDVLSQFLNLNKIPGSIPSSPAVLIK